MVDAAAALRRTLPEAIPLGVNTLLPWLRLQSRALVVLAALALFAPALAAATTPAAAATPFSIVICTTEGLVSLPLGDEQPGGPAGHSDIEHCPACLRVDLAAAPPPAAATLPLPAAVPQRQARLANALSEPRAPPHVRPHPTGPPARD